MIVQTHAAERCAVHGEPLRRLGNRVDPVGNLLERRPGFCRRRGLCLQSDDREDILVVVARAVIDLAQRLVEKRQALLALRRAFVDLALIEADRDEQDEERGARGNQPADGAGGGG